MPKSLFDNGVILITGATSEIGREISKNLSVRAKTLVLVAQKRDKLEELAKELKLKNQNLDIITEPYDVSRIEEIDRIMDSILRRTQHVDILINNAGMGSIALFEKSDWHQDLHMINLNVIGLTKMTHRLLPMMVERKKGGIINVASGASFISIPGAAVYNATKQYIHGFTDSLNMELTGAGVTVTEVCPGPVTSPHISQQNQGETKPAISYHPLRISPEQAANEIIRGFEKKQDVIYPGFLYRWSMYFASFVPTFAIRFLGKSVSYWARRKESPMLEKKKD